MNNFYVYIYWIDDVPFYVGKGRRDRYRAHFQPNEYEQGGTLMQRKMAKLIRGGRRDDIKITFFIKDVDEETTFFWEGFIIRALGRRCDRDGCLCNLTWGGDRTNTGYKHSPARREKISQATRARYRASWLDPKKRKLRRQNRKGRKYIRTPESEVARIKKNEARQQEQIRRLQAGTISWQRGRRGRRGRPSNWKVIVNGDVVSTPRTYVEAERDRVNACKAIRDGCYDEWRKNLRHHYKVVLKERTDKKYEIQRIEKKIVDKARSTKWQAKKITKQVHEYIQDVEKRQNKDQQLRESPWLVDSPYCVFVLLVEKQVEYIGFGRPNRIWRLLYKNEKPEAAVKQWLATLEEKAQVQAIFMETREQAKCWRAAMVEVYEPSVNRHIKPCRLKLRPRPTYNKVPPVKISPE